ncbi:autoinducer binding domain-containing protein [Limimaricola sp.]|uniref:autoinducer binding domain-containing protein n=1 Tax=Limimaricola sp. TaxID=2211665 RepID=UPI004057CD19
MYALTGHVPDSGFSFITRAAQIRDVDKLWKLVCNQMAAYGFDRLLYGITRMSDGGPFDPDGWLVIGTHDETYRHRLFEDGLLRGARVTDWLQSHSGTFLWSRYDDLPPGDPVVEFRLKELRRAHDIHAGAVMSFPPTSPCTRGVISLTARADLGQRLVDDLWHEAGQEIEAQLQYFHLRYLSLPFGPYRLTDRQRQVLELVARGHTTQDMARRLDLTPATIDKHLRLARETLSVRTTAQAVLKASLYNQI